jgi:hypothetical protein
MPMAWTLLLALPAGWGLGLGIAALIDRSSNMLPAITILMTLAVLVVVAVMPWATQAVRLKVMQGLAIAGLLLMLSLA